MGSNCYKERKESKVNWGYSSNLQLQDMKYELSSAADSVPEAFKNDESGFLERTKENRGWGNGLKHGVRVLWLMNRTWKDFRRTRKSHRREILLLNYDGETAKMNKLIMFYNFSRFV